jgi:hypothetical protein
MARRLATNSACQAGSSKMPPCPRSGWCITCEQGQKLRVCLRIWDSSAHCWQAQCMQLVAFGLAVWLCMCMGKCTGCRACSVSTGSHLAGVACQLHVLHDQLRRHQVIPSRQHNQAAGTCQASRQANRDGVTEGGNSGTHKPNSRKHTSSQRLASITHQQKPPRFITATTCTHSRPTQSTHTAAPAAGQVLWPHHQL